MKKGECEMSRSIKIVDNNQQLIGESMTASDTDILQYLAKGLKVIDKKTGDVITESDITSTMGVSDGELIME
jgi:hypothetical protein